MASVVNVKKAVLKNRGFADLEEWKQNPNHVYIGRNMSFYVPGAQASKWKNPFTVKKNGLEKCLEMYEEHVRSGPLYQQLGELRGKVLGCWCHPAPCHGDVLCRLIREMDEPK